MKTFRLATVAATLALLLAGCATGIIYTHTVRPLTLDMHRTPITQTEKEGSIKLIKFPPLVYSIGLVAWDSAAIGDVAKKHGLQEIYYADLETFSILNVWNEYTVHVYGK